MPGGGGRRENFWRDQGLEDAWLLGRSVLSNPGVPGFQAPPVVASSPYLALSAPGGGTQFPRSLLVGSAAQPPPGSAAQPPRELCTEAGLEIPREIDVRRDLEEAWLAGLLFDLLSFQAVGHRELSSPSAPLCQLSPYCVAGVGGMCGGLSSRGFCVRFGPRYSQNPDSPRRGIGAERLGFSISCVGFLSNFLRHFRSYAGVRGFDVQSSSSGPLLQIGRAHV